MQVTWDEEEWRGIYPHFDADGKSPVTSAQLDGLWMIATTLVDNTDAGAIPYDPQNGVFVRKVVLQLVMCHLATLAKNEAEGQYGFVASASEGTVNVSFQAPQLPAGGLTQAWYAQTSCGLSAWTILRRMAAGGRYYGVRTYHPFG